MTINIYYIRNSIIILSKIFLRLCKFVDNIVYVNTLNLIIEI